MNKEKIKYVRTMIEKILSQHSTELKTAGVSITTGNAKYNDTNATMKILINDLTGDGKIVNVGEVEWKNCTSNPYNGYNLNPDWLGKTYNQGNKAFTVVGLNPRKRKNCVLLTCSDGKPYITSERMLNMVFGEFKPVFPSLKITKLN